MNLPPLLRLFLPLFPPLAMLVACTPLPDMGALPDPGNQPPPRILPLDQVLAAAGPTPDGTETAKALDARAAALRARAAALRSGG